MSKGDAPDVYARNCPCREVLDLVSSKWSALIIGALQCGPQRFGQLRRTIEGVTQKMLSQTLRELERDGLVKRTVYPTMPPRVEYALTALGHSVAVPLASIRTWAEQHLCEVQAARIAYEGRRDALADAAPAGTKGRDGKADLKSTHEPPPSPRP